MKVVICFLLSESQKYKKRYKLSLPLKILTLKGKIYRINQKM